MISSKKPARPTECVVLPGVLITLMAALLCVVLSGCVTVPQAELDGRTTRAALESHVSFLAQPALKGREPRTRGSRLSRRYIENRFKAYGLVPWGQAEDYEQSFGYGRNVVGVLPGADPDLASEFVLVCAHYDHLGKHKGEIHLGAADNASGIAVLLETARRLCQLETPPKRCVAFVAFDCEEQMLLGSFAFTCRDDVRQARIAGVINLDMLGREFMDVVTDTVFVAGTEEYPDLRERVRELGSQSGLRLLPVGTDLIGPRSDHAAFESLGVPCLFFTCGMYPDYHKATDTADKLDYTLIERSSDVVFHTACQLASTTAMKRTEVSDAGDLDELRSVTTVLAEVLENGEKAGMKKEDAEAFQQLKEQAEALLRTGRYDRRTRTELIMTATGTLAPYFWPTAASDKPSEATQSKQAASFMQLAQHFYLNYRHELLEGYRELVSRLVEYRPGIVRGMPKFEFEVYDIADEDIHLVATGAATFELYALANQFTVAAEVKRSKWLVNSFTAGLAGGLTAFHCEGTQDQLQDYCLLQLRAQQTNATRAAKLGQLVQTVSGTDENRSYQDLLSERLEAGRFTDEDDWLTHCILTGPPPLARRALWTAREGKPSLQNAAREVLKDRNRPSEVRADALKVLVNIGDREGLLAVCDILDDPAPVNATGYDPFLREESPFADRAVAKAFRALIEQYVQQSAAGANTLGALAREQLKELAGTDLGPEATDWRNWIEAHVKE